MPAALLLFLAAVPIGDYAGAAACAECHPAEAKAQALSAHARALAPSTQSQPGEWAFGAGTQAITFVQRLDSATYLENGKTWYRRIDGYARTPGATSDAGTRYRTFDPSAGILRCFACHSTGPLSISEGGEIASHELGIRCEACHGPAADHARHPANVHPKNPGRLPAAELNALCGECHRMPAGAADTPDLRNPWNARHQPLLLSASACFRRSQGRLSCLTCHSPHAPLERDPAAYDAKCAACHAAVQHTTTTQGRACVSCHMPEVQPSPQLKFANHRIAIYRAGDSLTPAARRR